MIFDECTSCLGWEDTYEKLRAELAAAKAENERLKEAVESQMQTIEALNTCIGGEGSLTTDNLTRIARLETERDKLLAEREELVAQPPIGRFMKHSEFGPWVEVSSGGTAFYARPVPAVPERIAGFSERVNAMRDSITAAPQNGESNG